MITFIKRFFTDESLFERSFRSILLLVGTMGATGQVAPPWRNPWPWVAGVAGMIHAGDPNPKPPTP